MPVICGTVRVTANFTNLLQYLAVHRHHTKTHSSIGYPHTVHISPASCTQRSMLLPPSFNPITAFKLSISCPPLSSWCQPAHTRTQQNSSHCMIENEHWSLTNDVKEHSDRHAKRTVQPARRFKDNRVVEISLAHLLAHVHLLLRQHELNVRWR